MTSRGNAKISETAAVFERGDCTVCTANLHIWGFLKKTPGYQAFCTYWNRIFNWPIRRRIRDFMFLRLIWLVAAKAEVWYRVWSFHNKRWKGDFIFRKRRGYQRQQRRLHNHPTSNEEVMLVLYIQNMINKTAFTVTTKNTHLLCKSALPGILISKLKRFNFFRKRSKIIET
jgi:hypothetical protein